MSKFDWLQFLQSRGIDYVTSGPNVARGNVNIKCVWCGDADSSHHLGIALSGSGWGCWRNKDHRGRSPVRLIARLIGCSFREAARISGTRDVLLVGDDAFEEQVKTLMGEVEEDGTPVKPLRWPPEFKKMRDEGMGRLFFDYLVNERGYYRSDAENLAEIYGLRYCITGAFRYRLVIPVYMEEGLVNWTGRAINRSAVVRYRSLSMDPEKAKADGLPVAARGIDATLFNYDVLLNGGNTLVLVEGPLDAIRVDYLGMLNGVRSTCLFGTGNLTIEQMLLLDRVVMRFKKRILLLDPDAKLVAMQKMSQLEYLGFETRDVPAGRDDPAEMTLSEVRALIN